MAFEITTLSVDLKRDVATVGIQEKGGPGRNTTVNLQVPIATPGNQPEHRLESIAREAAKKALEGALAAL